MANPEPEIQRITLKVEDSETSESREPTATRPRSADPRARWICPLFFLASSFIATVGGFAEPGPSQALYFIVALAFVLRVLTWLARWDACFRFADAGFLGLIWSSQVAPQEGWMGTTTRGVFVLLVATIILRAVSMRRWSAKNAEIETMLFFVFLGCSAGGPPAAIWILPQGLFIFLIFLDFAQRADLHRQRLWQASLPEEDPRKSEVIVTGP